MCERFRTLLQASIIHLFEDSDSLNIAQIAAKIGLDEKIVEKRISFWVSKGILIGEAGNVFRCVAENEEIVATGTDLNQETAEQLEQERAQAELEARFKVINESNWSKTECLQQL